MSAPSEATAGVDFPRRLVAAVVFFGLLSSSAGSRATAEPAPAPVRVGLCVGAPVGLTAALDATRAFSAHLIVSPAVDSSELGVRLDLVYRPPGLGGELGSIGQLSFWFGPGLRWTTELRAESSVGVRVPFGVSLLTSRVGHELYAEIAPALDLHPERRASVEAGLGLRLALY